MRKPMKLLLLSFLLFLCLPILPLGDFAKLFVSSDIAKQLSSVELKEVEAQTKKPPSTVGTVGRSPNFIVHSATNVTLYADKVAVNVVWDGTKRFDRILDNRAKQPWSVAPLSYWAKWKVEWYKGTPLATPWVALTESSVWFSSPVKNATGLFLVVNQTMNDGSIFTVTYKILNTNGRLKWDLKLKASCAWSTKYRFCYEYFSLPSQKERITSKVTQTSTSSIIFTYASGFNLTFFYGDVNMATYPVAETWDSTNHKDYFYIDLGSFSTWQTKKIDPSTVGTSEVYSAVSEGFQRKSFYAVTRHWVWYCNGTHLGYATSTDGSGWSGFNAVRACTRGYEFSTTFDGTFVHYVYCNRALNNNICYRQGTPTSGGSINWSAGEQTVVAAVADIYYRMVTIAADSSGYPWVGYFRRNDTLGTGTPYISKSSTNNGAWTTAGGFPYELSTTQGDPWVAVPIPLTSSKVYVVYADYNAGQKGKLWSGAAWGDEETISALQIRDSTYLSATNEGDHVHYAFLEEESYDIHYVKRTYGAGWGGAENVQLGTAQSPPVLSIDPATTNLYCFWAGSPTENHIYYKKRASGTWDTNPTDWIDESADGLTQYVLTCFYQAYSTSSIMGLAYLTRSSPSYYVRYAFLTLNTAPVNGAASFSDLDDTNNLYAQKKYYTATSVATDAEGYADMHYMRFRIKQGATMRAEFEYHEDDNSFSKISGASWDLSTGTCSASRSGTQITATWKIAALWNAVEESNLSIEVYVEDVAAASDTDTAQSNYMDVVTRLVTDSFQASPSSLDVGGTVTCTGTVYYANNPGSNTASSSYPPDSEFTSVKIHDASHNVLATDTTISNGAFNPSFTVPVGTTNVYHVYLDMTDAEYTDADAPDGDTVTQYKVTITSSGISTDSSGTVATLDSQAKSQAQLPYDRWCNSGYSLSYSFSSPVSAGSTKRYAWSSTSGLGQSLQSNTFAVSATGTITGTYTIQWQVTYTSSGIGSDTSTNTVVTVDSVAKQQSQLPFSTWYNNGASSSYAFASPVSTTDSNKRYVWSSTSGLSQTLQSNTFSVTSGGTVTGTYHTEYQVTMDSSGIGGDSSGTVATLDGEAKTQAQLPYAKWLDNGYSLSYSFSSPVTATSVKRYAWSSTSGLSQTLQSNTFAVSSGGTITGTYGTQWQVTITSSGIGGDSSGTVATLGGNAKTQAQLPYTDWFPAGSLAYSFSSPVSATTGKQYTWSSTSGLGQTLQSNTFSLTSNGTITGTYGIQFYLTVTSSYGSPTGQGWYDSGASVSSTVTRPVSGGANTQYETMGFTGTGSAPSSSTWQTSTTGSFSITQASSVTWNWATQYRPVITLGGTSAGDTVSITARTVLGASNTPSGLYSSWTDWCDSGTTLTFSSTSSSGRQCRSTTARSWTVSSEFSGSPSWDRVEWHTFGCTDSDKLVGRNTAARVWVKGKYQFDSTAFSGAGCAVSINGTAATWDAANGYWYADIVVNAISNRTFAVSSFTDGNYGLTVSATSASAIYVQWTDITLAGTAVLGSSGTYQPQFNVTATWAHNSTALLGGSFYVYNATAQRASASASNTGLIQFTIAGSLTGSGTLTVNGTRSGIAVYSPLSLSYSIAVTGASYTVCPSDWYAGSPQTVTVQFTNSAQLASTKVKLENVRVLFRVFKTSTVFQLNCSVFDVDADTAKAVSPTLLLTGISETGTYTLRCLILQLGSEYTLATVDRSIYVMAVGPPPPPPSETPKLAVGTFPALSLSQGQSRTVSVSVSVSEVASADLAVSDPVGVASSWVKVSAPSRLSVLSPADLQVTVTVPSDAQVGDYTVTIPLTASTGSGAARASIQFTLTVLTKGSTTDSADWLSGFSDLSPAFVVVIVLCVGVVAVAATYALTKPKKTRGRRYY